MTEEDESIHSMHTLYRYFACGKYGTANALLGEFSRTLPSDAEENPVEWLMSLLCICCVFDFGTWKVDKINLCLVLMEIRSLVLMKIPDDTQLQITIQHVSCIVYKKMCKLIYTDNPNLDLITYDDYVEYVNMVNIRQFL